MPAHPRDQGTGRVSAAAVSERLFYLGYIFRPIEIERRCAPVGFGLFRFLFQGDQTVILAHFSDAGFTQFFLVSFPVAYIAGRAFLLCVPDK